MTKVKVKIYPNYRIDGEGEHLGEDLKGQSYTYWNSMPDIEVPIELALKLESEQPQRFIIKDNKVREYLNLKINSEVEQEQIKQPTYNQPIQTKKIITKNELINMTKDEINDLAARLGYDVDTKNRKKTMINNLLNQIKED